jgi:hypothetical protein
MAFAVLSASAFMENSDFSRAITYGRLKKIFSDSNNTNLQWFLMYEMACFKNRF